MIWNGPWRNIEEDGSDDVEVSNAANQSIVAGSSVENIEVISCDLKLWTANQLLGVFYYQMT